jgi:hypothetical protein
MKLVSGIAQFAAGGGLTVLTTWLSGVYGPAVGAIIWVYPLLLYVSAIAMSAQGQPSKTIADFCYASFPTTVINAISALILGLLITHMPDHVDYAVLASIAISTVVGFITYQFKDLL